jgi:TatD DNase family protein
MIIDTHSHLYGEEFADDIDEVLQRARAAGIGKIFLPNINAASVEPMMALVRRHPGFLYPMMGLHPEDLGDDWREVLAQMEAQLAAPDHPFIAVGEVGLDYYWDRTLYDEQQEAFAIQVGWALKYDLPLMIHTRSAHREMVDVLKNDCKSSNSKLSNCKLHGVFHCFGGTSEEAEELLGFEGFMLGIGGVVTFKKSTLPEVLRETVPLERIVVETDSPYLAPVPFRGKRNESAFIVAVIDKLSEIYHVGSDEVRQITTRNALQTFAKGQE